MTDTTAFLCATCGVQFPPAAEAPARCPVCEDQRQYVAPGGQRWTTLDALRASHRNAFASESPGLLGVGAEPGFAIGQRALLVRAAGGNVLWDCISLIDDATVEIVRALGGLRCIAISHPHYFGTMIEWARAFDAPVLLHEDLARWIQRPGPEVELWSGETHALDDDLTLIRCGGHFAGGTVLHWSRGAGGRGALLAGDIVQVVADRRWVSFLFSYPNLIPLPPAEVQRIATTLAPYRYEHLLGAWWGRNVLGGADAAVQGWAGGCVRAAREGAEPSTGDPRG
jgi:hypothetical protein